MKTKEQYFKIMLTGNKEKLAKTTKNLTLIKLLSEDECDGIKYQITLNENTPNSILEKLSEGTFFLVQSSASNQLNKRRGANYEF